MTLHSVILHIRLTHTRHHQYNCKRSLGIKTGRSRQTVKSGHTQQWGWNGTTVLSLLALLEQNTNTDVHKGRVTEGSSGTERGREAILLQVAPTYSTQPRIYHAALREEYTSELLKGRDSWESKGRCSAYLLYWYKSTQTDVLHPGNFNIAPKGSSLVLNLLALLVQKYKY